MGASIGTRPPAGLDLGRFRPPRTGAAGGGLIQVNRTMLRRRSIELLQGQAASGQ
jgi:hypothetical protein